MSQLDTFTPSPAPRSALWETVAAALRRAIILGELPPGLHLEEPALAEKFGISRIPIREALTRLAHEGLVRIEPRRGAFIIGTTEEDIHDIYELRLLIELHAIRRAAERVNADDIARLRSIVEEMAEAVRNNQQHRVGEPDLNFHRQIIVLAGNRRLVAAWEPIGGLVATILSITDTHYHNMPESVESHRRLARALEQRHADTAERELRAHLENGEVIMRETMRTVRASAGAELTGILR